MNKHDELMERIRKAVLSTRYIQRDDALLTSLSDLLQLYGDVLVRIGDGDFDGNSCESLLENAMALAQTTVEGE